jgi:hypothetical protein
VEARPGLAAAIATGDGEALDRIERLVLIHGARTGADGGADHATAARAQGAMRRLWPRW